MNKILCYSFALLCIVEIIHTICGFLGVYSEGVGDIILHVAGYIFLITFSISFIIFLAKNYFFIKENSSYKLSYSRLSLTVGLYYLLFVVFYSFLLYISEGTVRGSGWFVSLPLIGVIFTSYGFFLSIIAYIILPIAIVFSIVGFFKKSRVESRKIAVLGFVVNVLMFVLIPWLSNFILD